MGKMMLDYLREKTKLGMQIKALQPEESFEEKAKALGAHRDDHYIFLLLTRGSGYLMVDLQDIVIGDGELFYVLPGQVHQHIRAKEAAGWFLAVDRALVPPACRDIFEGRLSLQQPRKLETATIVEFSDLCGLLAKRYAARPDTKFFEPIIHRLLETFLSMAAAAYDEEEADGGGKLSRPVTLAREFKLLMSQHIRTMKAPSAYASHFHVTTAYLNEAVKAVTGLSCSYWIQQEILMEAKRLLYHSDLTVKEIADELGYADAAYFSRFFRRGAGLPPLGFRLLHRR